MLKTTVATPERRFSPAVAVVLCVLVAGLLIWLGIHDGIIMSTPAPPS